MTPDNNTGDAILDRKNNENTEENTDTSSEVLLSAENQSENQDKISDFDANTDLDKDNIDTYNEIDIEKEELQQEESIIEESDASEPEEDSTAEPEEQTETDDKQEQNDTSEPVQTADNTNSDEQTDTSIEQNTVVVPESSEEQPEDQPENSPLAKGGSIAAESGNGGFESSEEEHKQDSIEQPEEDSEEQAEEPEDIQEQSESPEDQAEDSEDQPENSPFGAEAPSEASQRGLDFEGEDLKMGVLEDSIEQPEQAKSDSLDEDNEEEPELALEDLDDYRDEAKIETPEKLVDINEFLAMKRKSKEAEKASKKKKKKKADIFINRRKAKTLNAAVAAADPIIYFYNAALDKTGKIVFFNVYQVLQDRFMGKLIPQQYTAVAEGSSKIEELNIANIIEQVKVANQYPQYGFVLSMSARFFTRPKILEKLTKELATENKNLILAFDCVSLQNIGTAAKTGLSILRLNGAKIMLDNTEAVSMTSLTELEYDYIRIDARYYEKGDERSLSYLELLARFAESQGITTSATFCDEAYLAEYMLSRGITAVQGDAVSRPMRTVPNAVKAVTLLPSMLD